MKLVVVSPLDVWGVVRNAPVIAIGWPFVAVAGKRQRPQNQSTVLRL